MSDMTELETAAKAAGIVDLDILKLAKPGQSSEETISYLRGKYPGAFRVSSPEAPTLRDCRNMTNAEADAELKRYLENVQRYQILGAQRSVTKQIMERDGTNNGSRRR